MDAPGATLAHQRAGEGILDVDTSTARPTNTTPHSQHRRHKQEHDDSDASDNDGEVEEEEEESDEDEDEEPRLKYAYLTKHLKSIYRNGDATSCFMAAGDKMVRSLLTISYSTG